jgi:hypothetical protein
MRQRNAWAIGFVMLLLGWQTRVDALTAIPRTFVELVERADCVLIGTVMRGTAAVGADGEKIYTYVTLADLEVIKGEVPDTSYVLRIRGGTVDTQREVYPGLPQLEVGGRYILFVQGNFRDLFPVVGLAQGVFRVEWDPERQQEVVRTLQDQAHARTKGGTSLEQQLASSLSETSMTVEAFVQRIHAQLRLHPQEGPRVTSPGGSPSPGGTTP